MCEHIWPCWHGVSLFSVRPAECPWRCSWGRPGGRHLHLHPRSLVRAAAYTVHGNSRPEPRQLDLVGGRRRHPATAAFHVIIVELAPGDVRRHGAYEREALARRHSGRVGRPDRRRPQAPRWVPAGSSPPALTPCDRGGFPDGWRLCVDNGRGLPDLAFPAGHGVSCKTTTL